MSIETLFSEHRLHASMNICTGCDWRPIADNDPLADQHEAHLADLIRDALTGDEAREAVARGLAEDFGEVTRYSETAHPDHNRWSWLGDGHGEAFKNTFRKRADAAIAALVETLGGSRD